MSIQKKIYASKKRRAHRVRNKTRNTGKPRISVFKSATHIYAQLIDDAQMKTLATFTLAGWDFVSTWGIFEHQAYPYLRTQPSADLNSDGVVNFVDFAIFADQWLQGT